MKNYVCKALSAGDGKAKRNKKFIFPRAPVSHTEKGFAMSSEYWCTSGWVAPEHWLYSNRAEINNFIAILFSHFNNNTKNGQRIYAAFFCILLLCIFLMNPPERQTRLMSLFHSHFIFGLWMFCCSFSSAIPLVRCLFARWHKYEHFVYYFHGCSR